MALNRKVVAQEKKEFDGESNFTRLGAGEYEGRLVYVADLGLQERNFKGEEKPPAQQIALGIEIIGSDNNGMPRLLFTRPFNIFSKMNELGVEYKMYKVFNTSAQPDTVADWDAVLGEPCSVKVIVTKSKDGSAEYDNIDSLIPIPAKYRKDVGEARIVPAVGDCDDESNPVTQALYGLAKYIWEKRIEMPKKVSQKSTKPKQAVSPVDEDVPY
jgi:hypothetical protein